MLSLWLAACQATVRVGIRTSPGGSGTVTVTAVLDRDAAAAIPDLAQELRTADLQQAGWHVDGPKPAPGGGVTVSASKGFASPAEAAAVLGELSGPNGPFQLRLSRHRSFFSTSSTFDGTVDLTCGVQCFGDSQLQQQLGANLGLDPAKLQQAGISPSQLVGFEVGVHLPGSIGRTNAPARPNGDPQWQVKLGDRVSLLATARALDWARVVLLVVVIAGIVLLAAAAALVLWRRRRKGPPRRRASGPPRAGQKGRSKPRHTARSG